MSQTKFDICSRALNRCGANAIAAFDGSAEGIVAGNEYEPTLAAALSSYRWRWAVEQADLVRLADTPTARWEYAFQLPSGLLALHAVTRDDVPIVYDRYGDKIFTDEDDGLTADYTFRPDESKFSPEFIDALVLRLSGIFAVALNRDFTLGEKMDEAAKRAFAMARNADSQQQSTRRIAPSRLVAGRR